MKSSLAIRYWIIGGIVIASVATMVIRVGYLQLVDDTYIDRSRSYAISKTLIYPSRGMIYDREGRLLVHNEGTYDLLVTHSQIDAGMDTMKLCRLLGITKPIFEANITKDWKDPRFSRHTPFVFLDKVSTPSFLSVREILHEFPGFEFQSRNVRTYPYPHAAHVLGFIGEVSPEVVEQSDGAYLPGDYIGMAGLERSYEKQLRGEYGVQYHLKDNLGRTVGSWKQGAQDRSPVSGKDIECTIDIELTKYIESLMLNKKGSVVAIEPATGEILAMVSSPFYDPNLLTISQARSESFRALQADTLKPFFDRSVMAKYPPGSIFKAIVALIAFQEGLSRPDRHIGCAGAYYYKDESWKCHAHWPANNIQIALAVSCNTYFFTLVREILDKFGMKEVRKGLLLFNEYLNAFGLGRKLGVDIPNEKSGFLPTPEYYDQLYKKRKWLSPTIMNIGIGQGEIQLTTLQMAHLAAILANNGRFYYPHLLRRYRGDSTGIDPHFTTPHEVPINKKFFPPVIAGLDQVIRYGTASSSYIPGISLCGKTGTSQNPHGKDHSVFFGFAPKENPKIAIAIYIENAGFGGDFAAPIGSLIVERYLKGAVSSERQLLEQRMMQLNINAMP